MINFFMMRNAQNCIGWDIFDWIEQELFLEFRETVKRNRFLFPIQSDAVKVEDI